MATAAALLPLSSDLKCETLNLKVQIDSYNLAYMLKLKDVKLGYLSEQAVRASGLLLVYLWQGGH